jgi:hypothetical protein
MALVICDIGAHAQTLRGAPARTELLEVVGSLASSPKRA